jgi:hypothetical protein
VVWTQGNSPMRVWIRRHLAGSGWKAAQTLDTGKGYDAYSPHVTVNPAGSHAAAVWREANPSGDYSLFAKLYAAGAWSEAVLLADHVSTWTNPKVSIDPAGNTVAFWTEGIVLKATRHDAGAAGWGAPEIIAQHSHYAGIMDPDAGMDANGCTLLVWAHRAVNTYYIAASRYEPETGWSDMTCIDHLESFPTNSGGVQLAVNPAGHAAAVWQRADGIWSNRYEPGSGWGAAQLVVNGASSPDIAMDDAGNSLAVWQQLDSSRLNIWTARHVPGEGWSAPQLLETNDAGDAQRPQVAMNAAGGAVAAWQQSDGSRLNIWTARHAPGEDWQAARRIETTNDGDAQNPQVTIDSDGKGVAVWTQADGIWAARCE